MPGFDPVLLHVVNGDWAASTFLHTFGPSDRLLIHRDVLSCGPLPRLMKIGAWQNVRLEFWRGALSHLRDFDLEPSPIDILKNAGRLCERELPCIWAATGNSDQLMISFVLHLLAISGGDMGSVHVVQFEKHVDTGLRVRGTGDLTPAEMRAHPDPRKLSAIELAAYRDAWVAVTSSDPAAVSTYSARHPNAPWYLHEAVAKVLRRYPDRASGLNFWDRRLLKETGDQGPLAAAVVGHTNAAMFDDGDLMGELYTFSRVIGLSSTTLPRPLLNLSGSRQQIARAEVTLTEFGQQVLNGTASAYPANPIDDWAGGVHISSVKGNLWFNDHGAIVRP